MIKIGICRFIAWTGLYTGNPTRNVSEDAWNGAVLLFQIILLPKGNYVNANTDLSSFSGTEKVSGKEILSPKLTTRSCFLLFPKS